LQLSTRITVFMWLLLQNKLFTIDNLAKRGWMLPNICYICRNEQKMTQYLFQNCEFTRTVRDMILAEFSDVINITLDLTQGRYEQLITQKQDKNCKMLHITICFQLWKECCNIIFRETQATKEQIRDEIKLQYAQWFSTEIDWA
jgi:zinc-binding in reverse transcriptase